ncbi:MAG: hypothetical protein KAT86_07980, partial [Candidatus Latescibacteria bacterium]|nr:hypothetical protein [Candidatus Latescibacterota bacterium]
VRRQMSDVRKKLNALDLRPLPSALCAAGFGGMRQGRWDTNMPFGSCSKGCRGDKAATTPPAPALISTI